MPNFTTFPSPTLNNVTTNTVTLSGDATLPLQAVPLQQVTAITGGPYLPLIGGGPVTGAITLAGPTATLPGSAIQALHDALPANGGAIVLPANTTFLVTTAINISKPNVHLSAPSWNTTLLRDSGFTTGPVLAALITATNFIIENFTIDGNFVDQNISFDLQIGADYSLVRHMQILNSFGQGGIALGGDHSRATGNRVMGTGVSPPIEHGDGIFAAFHFTCMIDHNTIWGHGTSAIQFDGPGSLCIGNRVWGNHTYTGNPGGQIGTFPLSSDPNGGRGICIVGNTVGPSPVGAPAHGIEVGGVDVLVAGNVIDSANGYGITVISDGVTLTGNRIRNSPTADTNIDGILIYPNVTGFTITGNTIVDNRVTPIMRTGIWVQAGTSDNYTISGNTIAGWTFQPIVDLGTGRHKIIQANGGVDSELPAIISAATIQFLPNPVFNILGTVPITAITTTNDAIGRVITLFTQSALQFVAGATIANTITTTPDVPVTGVFDGVQWHFSFAGGSYLPLAGGVLSGPLTAPHLTSTGAATVGGPTGLNSILVINGATGSSRIVQWYTADSLRWQLGANTTAEGGGNTGSDLLLLGYADNGSTVASTPILITRSSGAITLAALQVSTSYVNDAAAAAGGVPLGQLYRNGSIVQIRVV